LSTHLCTYVYIIGQFNSAIILVFAKQNSAVDIFAFGIGLNKLNCYMIIAEK